MPSCPLLSIRREWQGRKRLKIGCRHKKRRDLRDFTTEYTELF